MREICTSGSVRGEGANPLAYSTWEGSSGLKFQVSSRRSRRSGLHTSHFTLPLRETGPGRRGARAECPWHSRSGRPCYWVPNAMNRVWEATHGRDAHATHGRDARGTHGRDARGTHGQDAHATQGRDARGTHGQDAHATHGRDARGTHGRDAHATRMPGGVTANLAAEPGCKANTISAGRDGRVFPLFQYTILGQGDFPVAPGVGRE